LSGGLALLGVRFAIMFGGSVRARGRAGKPIDGYSASSGQQCLQSTYLLWFIQRVFAATAATIVSGACRAHAIQATWPTASFVSR
jgi:ammonia channel protein AmtB